jgi:hypothetical protein
MQTMQRSQQTKALGSVRNDLPSMLCAAGVSYDTRQGQGEGNADLHSQTRGLTLTRGCFEVRKPDADETPLSESEQVVAMREGWAS